jgi:hypothetical protein
MVEPATFLRLTPGMTWTEAVALLGTTGRHGFTYRREDKTYVLTTCFVRNRPETESGIAFHCLFEDGVLARVLRSLPKNLEEYPYKGTTATRRKTWRVDDEQWILTILSLPGETRNAVARILEEYADPRPRNESNLPPWVFKILAPAYVARVRRGYERNAELLRRFDGHKIAIGMTKDEVDGLLGLPVHVEPTPSGKVLSIYSRKIYGKDREEKLEINPYFRFSPVAVVFDDGKACRVYSAGFISRDWMPDGEEYGL